VNCSANPKSASFPKVFPLWGIGGGLGVFAFVALLAAVSCNSGQNALRERIAADTLLTTVEEKALQVVGGGFNAGSHYSEVWIRDFNTFIRLAAQVHPKEVLRENLLQFFRFQGGDGNIVDGFVPKTAVNPSYDYIYSPLAPDHAAHKNTVETDQETSLVQAVYKYVRETGDADFLRTEVDGVSVADRMEMAMDFLMQHRFDQQYGLLWGATTADWGDVQPEHEWGVFLTDDSHRAIDIYDNAMFIIALDNLMELVPSAAERWRPIRSNIAERTMEHLWDTENQKFIPHIYLAGSPFDADFDENAIFYQGGTAIAIEANLLSKEQIKISLEKMVANREAAGAATIGLTLYPVYPEGSFKNPGMHPYGYQNGGDWTWFGGRMIQQLVRNGFVEEAYEHIRPMLERVVKNDGFFEWYTPDNQPKGAGVFKGAAGVLYDAIQLLKSH